MGFQNITAVKSAVEEKLQNPTTVVGDPSALPDTPEAPATPTTPETPETPEVVAGPTFDELASAPQPVAEQLSTDAEGYMDDKGLIMSGNYAELDANAPGTIIDNNKYQMGQADLNVTAEIGSTDSAAKVAGRDAEGYQAKTSIDQVQDNLATAATMDANEDALVDADSLALDKQGTATGVNEDGSVNYTGVALNDFATQDISRVIDTSTVSGKLLADKLGSGNYVDAKATVKGQLDILSGEFIDSKTGQPKIPSWAAGTARAVSRTIAFTGQSGTGAVMAMATAIMEATLPIAEADSKFFQSLTEKNLDNKQQQIINKANVLSKMDLADMDMRTTAAVNNAKAFMAYDMKNLENEQQVAIINTQAKVDAILEDSKQENLARRFSAESQNEMDMFYDKLNTTIETFNVEQRNTMEMFNKGELNDTYQFNAKLENARQEFYQEMQFTVDSANAKWRQDVETTNTKLAFEAAAFDVKNILDLTTEGLNQIWDRQDSLLDYSFKEGENEKDRENKIEIAKLELDAAIMVADREAAAARSAAKYSAGGSIAGEVVKSALKSTAVKEGVKAVGSAVAKSTIGSKIIAVGSKILGFFSDEKLKENIEKYGELPNGVGLYTWEWNDRAVELGAEGLPTYGVIAQDVRQYVPDAVSMGEDGYLRVDYSKVNV